jgi:hypothetical protein
MPLLYLLYTLLKALFLVGKEVVESCLYLRHIKSKLLLDADILYTNWHFLPTLILKK